MEKEIETRFLGIDKGALTKRLQELGAIDLGESKLDEIIFYDQDKTWQNKFVRLRRKGGKIELTYKERSGQGVDTAEEIELEVSDMEKCTHLFQHIGLVVHRELEKYRHSFRLGEVMLDIDTWPKIPTYVEVEGPSVEALQRVCLKLGLDWEKRFDGDAREVFKHYGHDLNKIATVTFAKFG